MTRGLTGYAIQQLEHGFYYYEANMLGSYAEDITSASMVGQ